MSWKPIETAPKDGTHILVALRNPSDAAKLEIERCHGPCKQKTVICVVNWWRDAWRDGPHEIFPPFIWHELPETSDEEHK